jgi:protein-tyrosine-phosphatase
MINMADPADHPSAETMAEADTGAAAAHGPHAILFMCGMNAIRSPMAEMIARHHLPKDVFVASAGVNAGERDQFVEEVLGENGLTLGRHQPQTLDDLEDSFFDLIITLSPEAHHTALELTRTMPVEVEYWPTFDPSGLGDSRDQKLSAYRSVRDELEKRIRKRFPAGA